MLLALKKFLSDSKMFEYEKHFKQCQKNNQPFIKAQKNLIDNNYLVKLDLITCDYDLSVDGKNKVKKLFEKEFDHLKSNKKTSIFKGYNIDKKLAWCDGVLPERLDTFCENLFNLSYNSCV